MYLVLHDVEIERASLHGLDVACRDQLRWWHVNNLLVEAQRSRKLL